VPTASSGATVLVTGGCGYIGSHTTLALSDAGYRPVVLDDLSNGDLRLLPSGVPFVKADCGDTARLVHLHRESPLAAIVHFAGKIIVTESISAPNIYYRANTTASQALIEFASARGIPVVFSSTAAVYGVPKEPGPIPETAPLNPISPYGRSKLATEWMLQDAAKAYSFRYCALRYFNVIGADAGGRTGQIGKSVTHLVKAASQTAMGAQPELKIFGVDYPTRDGTCERDYVHVSDLAEAHVLAVGHLLAGGDTLTVNCGYGRGYTVLEVVKAVSDVLGRELPLSMAPRRPADPPALIAETSAIKALLGWRPRYPDLKDGIASALAWEQKLTQLQ
jgi:UDP-glucose 4-epimerase